MQTLSRLLLILLTMTPGAYTQTASSKPLDVYFIDVEGGQATLLVSPAGQAMLIDAGWPGFAGRDAGRIEAAMKQAHVSRLDYVLVTHYHTDHVGGVAALAARVPIGTFIDHGATVESSTDPGYTAYLEARKRGKNLQAKPGDRIPVAGLDVTVVASNGETIKSPLPGAGASNPLCAAYKPQPADASENARSVGVVIAFGRFRMLDLGDLTWNVEHDLACPSNLIGPIDLYLTTHHGNQQSGPPALVHALKPRVAIMNNGADKGGSPAAWHIVRESPGLEDFWQLHTATAGGRDSNAPDDFIANLDETTSNMIRMSARQDGSFTVTNTRNSKTKTYPAGGAR
ncbi:MAG: competence protein ComEC [Acidobacteriota bacterium]